jgi:hypothetical protein
MKFDFGGIAHYPSRLLFRLLSSTNAALLTRKSNEPPVSSFTSAAAIWKNEVTGELLSLKMVDKYHLEGLNICDISFEDVHILGTQTGKPLSVGPGTDQCEHSVLRF